MRIKIINIHFFLCLILLSACEQPVDVIKLSKNAITVRLNEERVISAYQNNQVFSAISENQSIASAKIRDNTLYIKGNSLGKTKILIKKSNSNIDSVVVEVVKPYVLLYIWDTGWEIKPVDSNRMYDVINAMRNENNYLVRETVFELIADDNSTMNVYQNIADMQNGKIAVSGFYSVKDDGTFIFCEEENCHTYQLGSRYSSSVEYLFSELYHFWGIEYQSQIKRAKVPISKEIGELKSLVPPEPYTTFHLTKNLTQKYQNLYPDKAIEEAYLYTKVSILPYKDVSEEELSMHLH